MHQGGDTVKRWLLVALLLAGLSGTWYGLTRPSCRNLRDAMYNTARCYKTVHITYEDKQPLSQEYGLRQEIIKQPGKGAWAREYPVGRPIREFRTDGRFYEELTPGAPPFRSEQLWHHRRPLMVELKELWLRIQGKAPPRSGYLVDREQLPLGMIYSLTFPGSYVTEVYDKSTVESLGQERFLGRLTEKIRVTNKYDEVQVLNVDKESGIILKWDMTIQGKPYSIWEATSVRLNEPVDPALFRLSR